MGRGPGRLGDVGDRANVAKLGCADGRCCPAAASFGGTRWLGQRSRISPVTGPLSGSGLGRGSTGAVASPSTGFVGVESARSGVNAGFGLVGASVRLAALAPGGG